MAKLNKYGTDLDQVAANVHLGLADDDTVTILCCRCGRAARGCEE